LVHDTFIYAKKLSGGYIDEIHFGYQLLLKIGDLLYKLSVNKQYAVELWKDGVKLHHENELTQKKEDLSEYVDKIKQIESSYPQIRSESVCSNQFNCYACVRHQIEANDALVMPL
jgi:hypothetical protein